YYTLLEMNLLETNHTRIFAEIHKNGRIFRSAEDVADWIDGKGTTAEAFLEAFNSTNVQRRVQFADALARQFQAASVPALVVNGKYMINVSRQVSTIQMLDIAERLIANDPDDAGTATSGKPAGG
ncbi:MAG: DsbA family protein, partial [Pseudomonadales bacterium]|nr:DsbA family protein [Pseudomonadales bacterium]